MSKIQIKEVPFSITILLAVIGFLINTLFQTISDTNYLYYSFEGTEHLENDSIHQNVTCILENLSQKSSYHNLSVDIGFKQSDDNIYFNRVLEPEIEEISPSKILDNNAVSNTGNFTNHYKIPVMNSGNKYLLKMEVIKNKMLKNEYPKIYLESNDNVQLIDGSYFSWLIRYKIEIVFFTIVLLILIFFFIYLNIPNE